VLARRLGCDVSASIETRGACPGPLVGFAGGGLADFARGGPLRSTDTDPSSGFCGGRSACGAAMVGGGGGRVSTA